MNDNQARTYRTAGGIAVTRTARIESRTDAIHSLAEALDERFGVLLTSSFEYPGRYTRWDMGFCDPALSFTGRHRTFEIRACNERGAVLVPAIVAALEGCDAVEALEIRLSPRLGNGARVRRVVPGGAAQQAADPVLGGTRAERPLPQSRGFASRALWRIRLRARVPVRPDPSS